MRIDNSHSANNAYGRMGIGVNNGGRRTAACNFGDILQGQASKAAAPEPGVKESAAVEFDLTSKVLDLSDTEAVGKYDGFSGDPELRAYGRQLALESGIAFINDADAGKAKDLQGEFLYLLEQLFDKGLISRRDIVDAVEFPPKEAAKEDGGLAADLNLLRAIKR